MRLGFSVPFKNERGAVLSAKELASRARMIEEADLEGIWLGDHLTPTRPDPLLWLLTAAIATDRVEIGTCVYIVSIREPYDLAQRFVTLAALAGGRLTIGVGAGSSRREHELMQVCFDDRFRRLHGHMTTIRRFWDGESVDGAAHPQSSSIVRPPGQSDPWGNLVPRPRFVIGAWHSGIWLKRAVANYDGWMCSAGRTTFATIADGIKRYRDLGGQRAMISTCNVDLSAPTRRIAADEPFHLQCQPEDAAERLQMLIAMGFDDILLVKSDFAQPRPAYETDFTMDDLQLVRSLVAKDERPPFQAGPSVARPPVDPR